MFAKVAVCFACVAVFAARAQYYPAAYPSAAAVVHAAPVAYPAYPAAAYQPVNPNPAYSYKYGVSDPATGDYKTAEESLSNGVVQGQYSLAEPDGTVRTVSYTADDVHGFVAQVTKGAKVVAPAAPVYSAPAPVYSAPAPVYAAAPAPVYAPAVHAPVYAPAVSYPLPYKRQA
ncbi:PREDICTED: cuticle protein 7-like [Diuraphis noxia]|uniref:cuticle protein 7-like n=1 Tax=Diuraphis noxia TaxID=143948 RepID=UPI0007635D06|nr:PREDICTED: cuticle protein 7-like [Diuraphis noxia]